jgi:proteasome lid subunit RPN8/RPN11
VSAPPPRAAVRLPRDIAEAIAGHAREARPNEACGLIAGSARESDGGVARRYVPCRNAASSPSRFIVDRDDLLDFLSEVDEAGEELWGVVHSHVRTEAVPSRTDLDEAQWPAAVYVLVSLAGEPEPNGQPDGDVDGDGVGQIGGVGLGQPLPALRAWRIADGAAGEVALVIEAAT